MTCKVCTRKYSNIYLIYFSDVLQKVYFIKILLISSPFKSDSLIKKEASTTESSTHIKTLYAKS